jgi:hypothetical protein
MDSKDIYLLQCCYKLQLEKIKPQFWGTLQLNKESCCKKDPEVGMKLCTSIIYGISNHFVRNQVQYFVRLVYSEKLHYHFFVHLPTNPNLKPKTSSILNQIKKEKFVERFFSASEFFKSRRSKFPFPAADLDLRFYDSSKAAVGYTTIAQKNNPDKLENLDISLFGDGQFAYESNIVIDDEILKEVMIDQELILV